MPSEEWYEIHSDNERTRTYLAHDCGELDCPTPGPQRFGDRAGADNAIAEARDAGMRGRLGVVHVTHSVTAVGPGSPPKGPDYSALKCPACGNVRHFREIALRKTEQRFKMGTTGPDPAEPDWDTFDILDCETFPIEIRCAAQPEGLDHSADLTCDTIMWSGRAETAGGTVGKRD
jgi:hypothetical protein